MSKNGKFLDQRQKSIFDFIREQSVARPPASGDLNIHIQLKNALSEALRKSSYSRFQVAARMSELLGIEVTKTTLDTWTAESKESHRFPAEYLPAFCEAVGNSDVLELIVLKARGFLFKDADVLRAEIQKVDEKIRKLQADKRRMRLFVEAQEESC
ncbi:MAG TPA: hypothetical protein PKM59_04845 [Thermodesulfobacteriota bacterium]|nr:hypothetical protein [Thermodesulfobacteriota bacterium]HNU70398.1 hypothetical protein [Thermodesulfobacteriota bacterium]